MRARATKLQQARLVCDSSMPHDTISVQYKASLYFSLSCRRRITLWVDTRNISLEMGMYRFVCFPPFFFSDLAGWHRTTIGRSNGQTKSDGSWLQQGSAGRLAWPRQHPSSWDPNPGMVPCQAKTGLTLKVEATYTQIKTRVLQNIGFFYYLGCAPYEYAGLRLNSDGEILPQYFGLYSFIMGKVFESEQIEEKLIKF